MLAHCKLLMFSVCASQAAARKAQPLWQQLGFQAKINERKKWGFKMPRIKGSYNAGMKTLVPWLNCARANSERYSPKLIFHFLTKIFIVHTDLFDLCLRVFWLFSSEYLQFSCFFLKEFWLFVFYGNLFGCLLRRRRRCSASDTSSTNSRVYVRQLCSEYQEIWL